MVGEMITIGLFSVHRYIRYAQRKRRVPLLLHNQSYDNTRGNSNLAFLLGGIDLQMHSHGRSHFGHGGLGLTF
jgi:hypothetical protein